MSSLRSDRAKRRAAKIRNTRIFALVILLVILAGGAYIIISNQKDTSSPSSNENTITMPSGLSYQDLVVGSGQEAQQGDSVSVHYTGWLEDGTKFDSSIDRGTPFTFVLGAGNVIQGWDEGIVGMKIGGKRRLTIPPHLAYGEQGFSGVIPPNATMIFEVELVNIQ